MALITLLFEKQIKWTGSYILFNNLLSSSISFAITANFTDVILSIHGERKFQLQINHRRRRGRGRGA